MVGPGEVDNDLQPEISEECARYGKVEKCLIFEVFCFTITYNSLKITLFFVDKNSL
jgi:hypothetical protein